MALEQLDEFYDYKNKVIEEILTDEQLVHLINPNVSLADAKDLVYTQVFPYEFVPETMQEGKTYICCDVDIQKSVNDLILSPTIFIYVMSHSSVLRLDEGGIRPDKICALIAQKLNGSRRFGLGSLDLYSVKRFAILTDYPGKVMTFYARDYNRQFDPRRYTPVNRKEG